MSETFYY